VTRRPRIRPEVVVRKLTNRGESYVIVKEPDAQRYFKFEAWEYDLLVKIDGTRTPEELAAELAREHPEQQAGLQYVTDYLEELRGMGVLERSEQERHLVMMDKIRELRKRRFLQARVSSIFMVQFQILDPDRVMGRILPWIRWAWSPWFVVCCLAVFTVVVSFLMVHWDLYWGGFFQLVSVEGKTFLDWVGLFLLVFFVSMWHELGHGFTCKRFGGEVHDVGFMLFYLQPAFYCNIDDSYLFPKLSHRLYCAFAGIYFELMVTSIAAGIWLFTPAEWWIHSVALAIVFFTGLSVIVININPLIKLDGYYALMDWLDVPELREESFAYIGGLVRRHLFHLEVPRVAISRRRRRIYLVYGLVSLGYTSTIIFVIVSFLRGWFVDWFGPAGYLALVLLLVYMFRRLLARFVAFCRHVWLDKKEVLLSPRRGTMAGAALAAVLLLGTVPRFPTRVDGSFTVEPGRRGAVRAQTEGTVMDVRVIEGQAVRKGDVLAVMQNADLLAARARAEADCARARREEAAARADGDAATAEEAAERAREAEGRRETVSRRVTALTLYAPLDGVLATHRPEDLLGRHLAEGESFCEVHDLGRVRLVVSLPEHEVEEVEEQVPVRLLASAHPERTIEASVLSVAPVAEAPPETDAHLDLVKRGHSVRVQIEVSNRDGLLRSGMTGRVQFLTRPRTLFGKVWWRLSRWGASVFW